MTEKKEATSTVVAKINNISIVLLNENNVKTVPVKPICEILGIDIDSQRKKIKEDEILSSVTVLSTATGSDGKQYEMLTIPLQYVFGWLFTINPKNVNPDAKEAVIKYKKECYDVLYRHFVEHREFVEQKQQEVETLLSIADSARRDFRNARSVLANVEKNLNEARKLTFNEWKDRQRIQQLPLQFEESVNQ